MRRFFWFSRNLAILSSANGFAAGYFPQDLNQGFRQMDFRLEVATVNEAFWGRIAFFTNSHFLKSYVFQKFGLPFKNPFAKPRFLESDILY